MPKFAVVAVALRSAAGHGLITDPPNRVGGNYEIAGTVCGNNMDGTQVESACAWLTPRIQLQGAPDLTDPLLLTTEESIANPDDFTHSDSKNPWRSPGSVPVRSPCGNGFWHDELDALDLPPNSKKATWVAGTNVKVASALFVNHGGGWSYRLCPKTDAMTESCFNSNPLKFVGEATARFTDGRQVPISMRRTSDGIWSRNPIPPAKEGHDASKGLEFAMPDGMGGAEPMSWDFSIVEEVALPADLVSGEYLMSWRWDCEKSSQVWFSCADVTVQGSVLV